MRTGSSRERGAIMAASAIGLAAFLALAAVAVDLGRLGFTATEVQSIADVAATAGAKALLADGDVVAEALSVASQNTVDGQPASIAAGDVQVGSWDPASGTFVAGGAPVNAVRANTSATVQNLIAGIFGDRFTTVQKSATATLSGPGAAQPTLPLALGECHFAEFQESLECGDLPALDEVPARDGDGGWSSLSSASATAEAVRQYLPASCGGGGETPPELRVGDDIRVMNGRATSLLRVVERCVEQGLTEYVVPIVPCGRSRGSLEVLGFATIHVEAVDARGRDRGIDLEAICNANVPGPPGGGIFGTASVALVS